MQQQQNLPENKLVVSSVETEAGRGRKGAGRGLRGTDQ